MSNTVIALRQSGETSNTPSLGVLANGELALNFADSILYFKTAANTLGTILTATPGGLDTEVQFNDAGSFGGDSGFTYNKTTDTLTVAGKVIAPSLRGYNALVGTASSATTTFVVTVVTKTSDHRYFGTGSALGYHIDGIESPFLTLLPGKTYRFTQEDGSNSTHQLLFYYTADKTTQYTTNVTTSGSAGSVGAYTEIVVTDTTPVVLHYQCINHGYMGNAAQFNSNVVDTSYEIIARGGINVGGINVSSVLTSSFNHANGSFDKANSANVLAQNAFNFANTANIKVDAAFSKANAANVLAQASFDLANTVNTNVTSAFTNADSAFSKANSANVIAQAAFDFANTISGGAAIDNVARSQANTAIIDSAAAFSKANSANVLAQAAFDTANNAATIGDILAISIALG